MDSNADITELLRDAPAGSYLLERSCRLRILWRTSEGEPGDDALEPAALWPGLLRSRTELA